MIIPNSTYKLLKRISKLKVFNIKPTNMRDIHILEEEGFIKIYNPFDTDKLLSNPQWINYFTITSKGRVYISDLKSQRLRTLLPIIVSSCLSIIAIIVSIFALLKP